MAITYVNDLRLSEMATGDNSGTWGTVTNTNLELIGEALGFGTEAITTNADTHASTIADGSTDPVRAMYVKYTGTLDSGCTITIGPNTVNKFYYIENATSGSQNIIISQGSGANVTIPAGDVKAVYLDGAGSGAAVTDAFSSLNVVDLKVQDDLTVTDDVSIGGELTVTGGLSVTGDTTTFSSANAEDPLIIIKDTTNDANAARLRFVKDKGAAGADDDDIGTIEFFADNDAQEQTKFALIRAEVADASDGTEGGKLRLQIASHDGEMQNGLIITDGSAEDEIDVTIGSGTSSLTTIAGDMAIPNGAIAVGQSSLSGGSVLADFHASGSGAGAQLAFANDHNTDKFFVGLAGNTTGNAFLYQQKNADIEFYTNNAIRGRLDLDGRLIVGTATSSNAHANADDLIVGNVPASGESRGITIVTGTDANGAIHFSDGTSSGSANIIGQIVYEHSNNAFVFYTGADEVMELDFSGNLAIKKDNTDIDTRLHIDNCPDSKVITFEQAGRKCAIGTFFSSGSTLSRLDFYLSDGNTNGGNNNRMSISSSGDVEVKTGNLVIGTAGKGIDFSAQTLDSGSVTSEILDHYEEGTFTPSVGSSSGSGGGASSATGNYTRIGNRVFADFFFTVSTLGSMSGVFFVVGFPYTSNAANVLAQGSVRSQGIGGANDIPVSFEMVAGNSYGRFHFFSGSSGQRTVQVSDISASDFIAASISYIV